MEIDVAFLVNFTKNVDIKTIILVIFQVGQAKKIATFLANVLISELALLVTTYFYKVCSCTEQEWIKLQMISQIFFEYLKHGIKK